MQSSFRQKIAIMAGFFGAALFGGVTYIFLQELLPVPVDTGGAVAWVLLPPVITVFFFVAMVGNSRFLTTAIDPIEGREPRFLIVTNRVLQNSLEQGFVFALAGCTLIALEGPGHSILPTLAILFMIARFLFWIGYLWNSLLRAPGMALTLLINIFLLGWAIKSSLQV